MPWWLREGKIRQWGVGTNEWQDVSVGSAVEVSVIGTVAVTLCVICIDYDMY